MTDKWIEGGPLTEDGTVKRQRRCHVTVTNLGTGRETCLICGEVLKHGTWTEADDQAVELVEAAEDLAVEEVIAEVEAGYVRPWVMAEGEEPCRRCGVPFDPALTGTCPECDAPRDETSDDEQARIENLARRDAP